MTGSCSKDGSELNSFDGRVVTQVFDMSNFTDLLPTTFRYYASRWKATLLHHTLVTRAIASALLTDCPPLHLCYIFKLWPPR